MQIAQKIPKFPVTRTPVRFTALKRWSIKVPNQSRPNICSRICSLKSVKPPAPHMAPFYRKTWPHICQAKIPKRQNPVHMHLQNNKNYDIIIIENKERRKKNWIKIAIRERHRRVINVGCKYSPCNNILLLLSGIYYNGEERKTVFDVWHRREVAPPNLYPA